MSVSCIRLVQTPKICQSVLKADSRTVLFTFGPKSIRSKVSTTHSFKNVTLHIGGKSFGVLVQPLDLYVTELQFIQSYSLIQLHTSPMFFVVVVDVCQA